MIYFATLPFGGKVACVGLQGLHQIIAIIQKQYADHQADVDLPFLRDWMQKLTASARQFEQVRVEMEKDVFRKAFVIDALHEDRRRVIKDALELEIFVNDRKLLDGTAESDEIEAITNDLINEDISMPRM